LSFWILRPSRAATAAAARQRAGEPGVPMREAVRNYRFWVIGLSFCFASAGTGGIIAHLVPMLTDQGFDAATAAWVAGAQGIALIFGRAVIGYLLDRFWAPAIAAFALVLPIASCVILAAGVTHVSVATAAVILVGFAAGAEFDLVAFLTARYFGMRHFGSLYGVLYAIFVSASGVAPGLFGRVFDATGSYATALYAGGVSLLIGAGMVLTLGRYPREYAVAIAAAAE
jgi:predicted MFS family arabinose efflux permease